MEFLRPTDLSCVPLAATSWPIGPDSKRVDIYLLRGMSKRNARDVCENVAEHLSPAVHEDAEQISSVMSKMPELMPD